VSKPNDTTGKMKPFRALELLNALIDHMIKLEGGHANRVIPTLLNVGFTTEELVEDFCFPAGDVENALSREGNCDG